MRLGKYTSSTHTISTGASQGCVLSQLLFCSPPLIIMNSTVTSVTPPSPRTWSGTITLSHIEKKAQQRLYFLHQLRKFNLPQELLKKLYSSLSKKLKSSLNLVQWIATKSDNWRLRTVVRTAERPLVHPSPLSKNCTYSEWAKGLVKFLWTPHIQHTPSLNYYHLVDATELWAPERPDTETVSSLKQSISWTLDNNYGTHNIYTLIHLTHILSLHFNCI